MPCSLICADDLEDLLHEERREAEGRLVEEQELRLGHQRAADREHLLLAAGERPARLASRSRRRGKSAEHALEAGSDSVSRPQVGAHLQVLAHREVREDAAALRHVGDAERHEHLGARAR